MSEELQSGGLSQMEHVDHEYSGSEIHQLHGKNIFLFGTAGFGGSEEYFNKILKTVERSLDRSNTVFGLSLIHI